MTKTFDYTRMNRGMHAVTFYTGTKFHRDGSHAADIRVTKTEREAKRVIRRLRAEGYTLR